MERKLVDFAYKSPIGASVLVRNVPAHVYCDGEFEEVMYEIDVAEEISNILDSALQEATYETVVVVDFPSA